MGRGRIPRGVLAGACAAALLAGCGPAERAMDPGAADADVAEGARTLPEALSSVTEEGPVRATVTLAPAAPRLGDPLTLELAVTAEPGVVVEMPEFGEALGRFSILDFAPRRSTGADGATEARQRYTLQAPMSGRLRIPGLRLEYVDERDGGGGAYRELLTDEIAFEVASVLPEGTAVDALLPPRPALPEVRPGWWGRWWPALLVLALLAGGGALAFAAWQRRAVERVRPKLMTVATTFLGLLPVMWGTESGSEVMKRIAAPMVGGLVSSTILTLVIIPVVYDIWKRLVLYRRARARVRALAPDGP